MGDETGRAFEHPEARAAACPPDGFFDRISLRDHVVDAEIGAFQTERGRRQRLRFNVVVEVRQQNSALDDDVDRVVSYDAITQAIAAALGAERLNLLETLADSIAGRLLSEPRALRCFVRVEKLDRGPGALGVEIVRDATGSGRAADGPAGPRPLIVFLSNAAIDSPSLSRLLDDAAADGPSILCVGPSPEPVPRSGDAASQRRIDLLAVEQNCWRLAARDGRCEVVRTRTELDWAAKDGRMSVWAPSKIVLDATDPPPGGSSDAVALAAWFAVRMRARGLRVVGADRPVTDLPVEMREP